MEKYEIEVKETLSSVITVEAHSLSEAIRLAKNQYHNEENILDENNLVDTEFLQTENVRISKQKNRKVKDIGLR